ncbi:MAG: aminotransferase class I/II-fold pyridoxal phosphate-dependent enzyme, partial [Candidatus Omnitrophica bacterium]|nr:aminotransferase class I/II-fold pyridoxal phosphate-dependent enzyme [Candidatus Omnitrophota bacterium]
RRYSLNYNPEEEILITVGVSEALDLSLRAILEPKDKVIVISPHFVAYPALTEIVGAIPIYLVTRQEENFKVNIKELKRLICQKPKVIILNNPTNPTGVVYSLTELKGIWEIIKNTNILIISDEVYDEINYVGKPSPFPLVDKKAKDRTILLNGFSKAYAMTGFRVGFACANKEIISAMTKIHSYSIMCAPIVSQIAACEAFKAYKELAKMKNEYKRRRDFIVEEFNRLGLKTIKPDGAFYCFSSIQKYKMDALEFAKRLLFKENVAVVPGSAFGKEFSGFIRISYANSLENLKEAIIRIERFLKNIDEKRS